MEPSGPVSHSDLETLFHPAVWTWFENRFGEPTNPQRDGWPVIKRGKDALIAAPTGSGKTLAAFLCAIDGLVQQASCGRLADNTQILYVSPLKALANDIQQNLLQPLAGIREAASSQQLSLPEIRAQVRTGDTPSSQRQKMLRHPPHILVTTPESLFILLTSLNGRQLLEQVGTVIVDEIHALAADKRGAHLSLSLERLEQLTGGPCQRIGLSATQSPIQAIGAFLTGADRCPVILDSGPRRQMELAIEVPGDELGAVASNEMWSEVYDRLAALISSHATTLVFVNTRRLAERITFQLGQRLGEEAVAAHHGSLSREIRLKTEEQLRERNLKAVVATASLELGIDIGHVDLVCQIGSTRLISLALQRIGRSGHWKGSTPKGRLFATTRDELLECAALVFAMHQGLLDKIRIPPAPLDILAQQVVAACVNQEWSEDALYRSFRRASPYASLSREDFDGVVTMLSEGISTRQGRRGAHLHRDRVNGKIRGRRGARLAAITSGGAIPDRADYLVKADPEELLIGTLDEDFAIESMQGDIFLLGNTSWRIRRVETGTVRVENAGGAPPTVPFWRGEAPARSDELSETLSQLRERILELNEQAAEEWLQERCGLDPRAAQQAVRYVAAGATSLGALPTRKRVVAERFFDESGGMQLVLHTPFGGRINRAWGLALRKRFCRSFNFELQAAATENGILLSLSDQHSFPLDSVFSFLSSCSVREVLVQALLAIPLFGTRWRWNAARALAILRFGQGRRVPPALQRIRSDDLLASVFPEQAACLEHIHGDIEIPKHPLIAETVKDCLTEAMDIEGLEQVLAQIEDGSIECLAVDTREPSPFSHELLNANPYAFLDDAPLEERRARAVQTRRSLPEKAEDLGALDQTAILRVEQEAWPRLANADELHDALLTLAVLTPREVAQSQQLLEQLVKERRAASLRLEDSQEEDVENDQAGQLWFAAERQQLIGLVYPGSKVVPDITLPDHLLWQHDRELEAGKEVAELLACRLQCSGPVTAGELSAQLHLPRTSVESGLRVLEGRGQILSGSFRGSSKGLEWCDRRLLARIHRLTLGRLRSEIQPSPPAEFMRFLFRWHHLAKGTRLYGEEGLSLVLNRLQGFEAGAGAWENFLLPNRIHQYQPELLDRLCLSGRFVWGRLSLPSSLEPETKRPEALSTRGVRPTRVAPVTFFERSQAATFFELRNLLDGVETPAGEPHRRLNLSHPAREVLAQLRSWGACFFQDLVRTTGRLPLEVEDGLWELVAAGLVAADGFDNLRFLIHPKRKKGYRQRNSRRSELKRLEQSMGRWTLLDAPGVTPGRNPDGAALECLALQLLARWGVVFRDLLARECLRPPWRELLLIYRRLEARGEVRGGRFVSGFVGEQFALPEALDALRALKRSRPTAEVIRISAADPLNLLGIVTPGPRVRPHPTRFLYFRDGVSVTEDDFLVGQPAAAASRA